MKIEKFPSGNPQGKGHIGLLLDWDNTRPVGARAKSSAQLLADYFTSMLVLSSSFKFKPVVGQTYYLYWIKSQWSLSLVSPSEWSDERREAYVGQCELHDDMTWTMNPSEDLSNRQAVLEAMASFHEAFVEKMDSEEPLEQMLPVYVEKLPYYQRLYASALTRSLRFSMTVGGQLSIKSNQWLEQLPARPLQLLGSNDE